MNIILKISIFFVSCVLYIAVNIFSFLLLFFSTTAYFLNENLGALILLIIIEGCVFCLSLWGLSTLGKKLFIVKK